MAHTRTHTHTRRLLNNQLDHERITEIVVEAVDIETEFLTEVRVCRARVVGFA